MTRRAAGGVVLDEGGIMLMASAHWLPVLLNGVARMDPSVAPADVLDRARAFFTEHQRGYSVFGVVGRDDDLLAAADAQGLVQFGEPAPLMAIEHPPDAVDVP